MKKVILFFAVAIATTIAFNANANTGKSKKSQKQPVQTGIADSATDQQVKQLYAKLATLENKLSKNAKAVENLQGAVETKYTTLEQLIDQKASNAFTAASALNDSTNAKVDTATSKLKKQNLKISDKLETIQSTVSGFAWIKYAVCVAFLGIVLLGYLMIKAKTDAAIASIV